MVNYQRVAWTSTVVYDLSDAQPMTTGHGPMFVPTMARLSFGEGEFAEITLHGPRVLDSGKLSKRVNGSISWDAEEVNDPSLWEISDELAPPQWVKELIVSATFGKVS